MAVKEKIESGYRNGERDGTKLWGGGQWRIQEAGLLKTKIA